MESPEGKIGKLLSDVVESLLTMLSEPIGPSQQLGSSSISMHTAINWILALFAVSLANAFGADDLPKLHGTLLGGGEKLASIVVFGEPGRWFSVGQRAGAYRVLAIEKGKVVLEKNGEAPVELFLIGATTRSEEKVAYAPFSRRWINSHMNPMLFQPQELSPRISKAWATMTKEEREEVVDFYLMHGWRMVRAELLRGGALTVEWENVYQNERVQRVNENKQLFERTLSDEQKALWDELAKPKMRMRVGDDFTPEQKRDLEATRKLSEKFLKTLTIAQESERATITDFTKGEW